MNKLICNLVFPLLIFIAVGDYYELPGTNHWKYSSHIKYCGMISKDVFSFSGIWNTSVNLYFPVARKTINLMGHSIKINEVTPTFIDITVISSDKNYKGGSSEQ